MLTVNLVLHATVQQAMQVMQQRSDAVMQLAQADRHLCHPDWKSPPGLSLQTME
jgi:hypothetical protein